MPTPLRKTAPARATPPPARAKPATEPPKPAPDPLASLHALANTQRATSASVRLWLDAHPGLSNTCRHAMVTYGYTDHLIHKWLKREYAFPFSVEVVRGIRENRY